MADLTPARKAKVERLIANGFSAERAVEIATESQLDQLAKHGGSDLFEPLPPLVDE